MIAAMGAKEALWRLHRAGYHVAIFVHDECVVSVPEDADLDSHRKRIAKTMEDAMAEFVEDASESVAQVTRAALGRVQSAWSEERASQKVKIYLGNLEFIDFKCYEM